MYICAETPMNFMFRLGNLIPMTPLYVYLNIPRSEILSSSAQEVRSWSLAHRGSSEEVKAREELKKPVWTCSSQLPVERERGQERLPQATLILNYPRRPAITRTQ